MDFVTPHHMTAFHFAVRPGHIASRLTLGCMLMFSAGCAVGPDYKKPDITDITPAKWKWQESNPRDAEPRGEWWKVFKDAELNRLETLALQNNQQLRAAVARVEQARAITRASAAAYAPEIKINAAGRREQTSGNLPSPVPVAIPPSRINTFSAPLELAYEIDLWGRVRRSVEAAHADSDAAAADYHSALLTLTSELAANYFLVKSLDAELAVLNRTQDTRQKTIGLIDQRVKAGSISEADLARARSELAGTKADIAEVKRQREETVNALAVLCGQSASTFHIRANGTSWSVPTIPAGIPASLIERRPDVAMAERNVASKNADIGVQTAGYFPAVSLTGQAGYLSKDINSLFTADSKVWSIGPGITVPITSFLLTKAKVNRSRAAHEEAVAVYRQAVLTAIQDVETSLIQIRQRREQSAAIEEAVSAARQAADLTRQRYDSGALGYLELLDVERTTLSTERQSVQVKAQRQIATVRLIKALGGAW